FGRVHEAELLKELGCPAFRIGDAQPVKPPYHEEVFLTGEVFVHGGVLTCEADTRPDLMRVRYDVVAVYCDSSIVGLEQRAEYADRSRLPRAVRAEESEDGATPDGEVYPFEYAQLPVGLSEPFDYDRIIHKLFEYAR